jgi:hypothetical protein
MNNTLAAADIQTGCMLLLVDLNMLETRCHSSWLWHDAWSKIREELICFIALYLSVLNSTPSKGSIKLYR